MNHKLPIILMILDGWGYRESPDANAIAKANTPTWDYLLDKHLNTTLSASGLDVGLPKNQMGNSEVGHLTIGAGHPVMQDLTRIDNAIDDHTFRKHPILLQAIAHAKKNGNAIHLLGLFSPGGVHSHENHWLELIQCAQKHEAPLVILHPFLDGRDTPPKSAKSSLEKLVQLSSNRVKIGSLCGRYYAMDRDKRYERLQPVYEMLTEGRAPFQASSADIALQMAYDRGETDEFVTPTLIAPNTQIQSGDCVIFMNFRADRARQLSHALIDSHFEGFARSKVPQLSQFITMTDYASDIPSQVLFPPIPLKKILGECLEEHQLKQLRIAETEKYAHVTFFLNGGRETPFIGEDRILIPSPKVATYDLSPEMSAQGITDAIVEAIEKKSHEVIICNYANADMVGHTGKLEATIQAIEYLDRCFAQILQAIEKFGGELLITADHGNAEIMFDDITHQAHTAHTSERVPFVYVGRKGSITQTSGTLSDIAPTLLTLLGITPPTEMQGTPLVKLT